jgi:hypothetical protein
MPPPAPRAPAPKAAAASAPGPKAAALRAPGHKAPAPKVAAARAPAPKAAAPRAPTPKAAVAARAPAPKAAAARSAVSTPRSSPDDGGRPVRERRRGQAGSKATLLLAELMTNLLMNSRGRADELCVLFQHYVCCSRTMWLLFLNYVCVVPELCVCWSWTMYLCWTMCVVPELCVLSQNYVGCVSRNHVYVWIMVLLEICLCMSRNYVGCVMPDVCQETSPRLLLRWHPSHDFSWILIGRRVRRRQYLILLLIF